MPRPKKSSPPHATSAQPSDVARPRHRISFLTCCLVLLPAVAIPAWLATDWWTGLPDDARATYVGRSSCIECHTQEANHFAGSHHDQAMAVANEQTVLGNFNNATLEHHGITSRMFRRDGQFWIHTEGPDGKLQDFRIKYVFGVEPLQQYMVEFDRTADMPEHEEARVQVLRVSWDTERKRWFYLDPPDVHDKLAPDDPLHWTGTAQNWNHMCASCHSTDVQKNFDVATRQYHTTFAEIDVSCESCHGPGSLHVELAKQRSPFWDRKRGYALKQLKGTSNQAEIESCAPCHSRRSMIAECSGHEAGYYDCFENELLRPDTYYPDGQIRDEVYVFGSFTQSKMYHKGIRCSDCHNPHSTKLHHEGNKVCTSCHAHSAAKYDTPAHHNHAQGSSGAQCVECHMPATPFMEVDLRRDHSLRIPRPDLSVKYQTPNACTGCHLERHVAQPTKTLDEATTSSLDYYADYLAAARAGNTTVANELARIDAWSAEWFQKWYGDAPRPHFADAFAAAWSNEASAAGQLAQVAADRDAAAIVRASALWELFLRDPQQAAPLATELIRNRNPQLRAVAVRSLAALPPERMAELVAPRLSDSTRLVRHAAANSLAGVSRQYLKLDQQRALTAALDELKQGLLVNQDLAGSHLELGILAERQNNPRQAIDAYRTAIHVQPGVTGPRSNLATLLEQMGDQQGALELRKQELVLVERDVKLAPEISSLQYRYGLLLYLNGRADEAVAPLRRATELEPSNADFHFMLALLYERQGRFQDALASLQRVTELAPEYPGWQEVVIRIRQQQLRASPPNPNSNAPAMQRPEQY
jgi:tetratricopeptide (TPR) repeat protein